MRPSLRFLTLAVIGWAGVRAAMLDSLPGAELFRITPSAARVAPIAATQFPSLDPLAPEPTVAQEAQPAFAEASAPIRYVQGMVGVPVVMSRGATAVYRLPAATQAASGDLPHRHGWQTSCPRRRARFTRNCRRSTNGLWQVLAACRTRGPGPRFQPRAFRSIPAGLIGCSCPPGHSSAASKAGSPVRARWQAADSLAPARRAPGSSTISIAA